MRTERRLVALAAFGMSVFFAVPSFGQKAAARPLLDAPLSSLLSIFDTSKLTGDARRTFDVLTLIIEDTYKETTEDKRNGYLQEFLSRSRDFVTEQPNSLQIWTVRAVAALELNQAREGREACQRMIELKASDLDDPRIRRVLAMLDRKGWFDSKPALEPKSPEARPLLEQNQTGPTILRDKLFGPGTVVLANYSAKWNNYNTYFGKMLGAIQNQWKRIAIESRTESLSGISVNVKFTVDSKGRITNIFFANSITSKQARANCINAITNEAPYGDWSDDMRAVLGSSQDLSLIFFY